MCMDALDHSQDQKKSGGKKTSVDAAPSSVRELSTGK